MSTGKRKDYIKWDEYFMGLAFLSAERSKDPSTQVGACIVSEEKNILSIGYNGLPRGCNDDEFPWERNDPDAAKNKYAYVAHAELNAITNSQGKSLKNSTIYVTLFPCNECAKLIIQSGIKQIIYASDKYADTFATITSKCLLDAAGVDYQQYEPTGRQILLSL